MKSAIRLAVVLVMAGTSTAVLAAESDTQGNEQQQMNTDAKATNDTADLGHGSGEPGRSAAQIKADEDAVKVAAIREQRQKDFLNEVWSSSP